MKKNNLQIKNGIAQPLGKGYYLMNGPKHEQGGIDVGKNLEVEGGEIIKVNPKSIKVLSNAKIMGNSTPAEYALGGLKDGTFENRYNKGFEYQEKFKDIHGLNDDGTKNKKARFGIFDWISSIFKSNPKNEEKTEYKTAFVRKQDNDSPTKKDSENVENDIAKREQILNNVAKEKGHNADKYYIPYLLNKEIKVNGAGRVSSNVLDSIAVNANKAGIPFKEGLGLAVEETKLGAIPNKSTKAWIENFVKTNNRKPTNEEIKQFEKTVLNASFTRNFGGIFPQFLINNHEWHQRGWEQSTKYKNILHNIESPLQHGFTLYKLGLYNTGDKNHSNKVKSAGEKAMNSEDVQNWLKTSEYGKKVKQKLGGQMKKAILGKYFRNKSIYVDNGLQRFQDWNKSKEVSDANLAENANRLKAFNEVAAIRQSKLPDESSYEHSMRTRNAFINNVGDVISEKFDRNTAYDASSLTRNDVSNDFINQQKKLGYNLNSDEMTQKYQDYIINKSKDVSNYLGDLYDSKRAQRRMAKYNKYAEKHNPIVNTGFRTTGVFNVTPEDSRTSYFASGIGERSKIGLKDSNKFNYDNVLGHELAHSRNLFNEVYNTNTETISTDHIHPQARRLLKATHILGNDASAKHDKAYNERYADLMGMRTDMRNLLGVDGISRRYRRSDVRKYLKTEHGKANRFLAGNNYNIGRTKRALNKVYKLGGESTSPSTGEKVKAKIGTKRVIKGHFSILSPEDWIIAGSNLAGSIINLASRHSLPQKSLKYNDPIPLVAIKNKTKVNINPELQELENAISEYKDVINKNTSSSQVSLNRLRNINLEKLNRVNKLYGEKENKETALINENNRNLQNIINSNINQQNVINQKNLENEIQTFNTNRLQRADAITDFVQNIAGTAGNIVSNIEQRRQFDKNLAATIMGYENIDAETKYKMIQELTERNKRNKKE